MRTHVPEKTNWRGSKIASKNCHESVPITKPSLSAILALSLLLSFFAVSTRAQNRVTGKVIDDKGTGLPGVNVVVEGTSTGVITDTNGDYQIGIPDGGNVLVFSFVGFVTEKVEIGNQSIINVTLLGDIAALQEVIVVGYGTQEKRDVTAAIASIDGESIKKIPTASTAQALQGQVAGVDIVSQGGRPGQGSSIRIRGRRSLTASNDPLIVIDGIPQTSNNTAILDQQDGGRREATESTLADINPQDIESIEVLKDAASTAIYGSRGANGVVLITTKRGSSGKTVVSFDSYYGVTSVTKVVDMMDGAQFAAMKRESRRRDAGGNVAWDGTIPSDDVIFEDAVELESIAQGRSTDYLDLVLQNGFQTNHQLGISGGSEKTQFNISVGYFNEDGIVEGIDFERLTGRINIDHRINDRFKIGTSTLISSSVQNWGSSAALGEAMANNPLGVPYDAEGNLLFLPTNDGIRTNPLSELVDGAYIDERRSTRIFSAFYVEAQILDGLQFRANIGPDLRYRKRGEFRGSLTNDNRGGPADAEIHNTNSVGFTLENILTYSKSFGERHRLGVTLLQSIQTSRIEDNRSEVANLPVESVGFHNIEIAEVKGRLESRLEETSLASFMGRINYDLDGKYLIQATLRADGSSRLASGDKWNFFPGLSAGWRIIDEDFMANVNFLNELKLRASYGEVGNTAVDPYQTFGRLRRTVYAFDETPAFGYGLDEIPNDQLTWETSATVDVGVDFGFLDGRLSGSLDLYQTNTTDLLLSRNLPFTSGYEDITQNISETRTKGIELGLNAVVVDKADFSWNINFNITSYKEEIIELALKDENGDPIDDIGNGWFVGQPIRAFFDYRKIGIWQSNEVDEALAQDNKVPGEIKLEDVDGDGVITPADRVVLGSDVPDYSGGITNQFTFKGFDLSIFFFFRQGQMIQDNFHTGNNSLFARYNNLDVDYWTIDNPTNANPRPNENQERPRNGSTLSYFDGSFVKLRNVTLGYNFPSAILDKLGLSQFRLYASAQNPVFWSKYDTWDPENNDQLRTRDIPTNKLFLVGLNVKF